MIFYQKLLWNIRPKLNSSTFWDFEPVLKHVWSKSTFFSAKSFNFDQTYLNLYYKVRCVSVCRHFNVRLTTPPVLMLWGTQGYQWLPYDLTEVIKLIGERFEPKNIFFQKKYPMSFLPHYCHSFHSTVIPSGLLSFLPYYCHSFRISVIPSKYSHSFWIIQRITNSN